MEFSNGRTFGLLLTLILMGLICTTSAYDFYVGGRDGWVQNPSESFIHWAQRMRFQVHDKLVFKYKKGEDSVLLVKKEDYDSCNVNNPIKKMDTGDSWFEFDRSGPFYFISGTNGGCAKGQKLVVVVLSDRRKPSPPSSPPSVSPSPIPSVTPPSPSPNTTPPSPPPVSPPTATPSSSPPAPTPASSDDSPAPAPSKDHHSSASVLTVSSLSVVMLVMILAGAVMN